MRVIALIEGLQPSVADSTTNSETTDPFQNSVTAFPRADQDPPASPFAALLAGGGSAAAAAGHGRYGAAAQVCARHTRTHCTHTYRHTPSSKPDLQHSKLQALVCLCVCACVCVCV